MSPLKQALCLIGVPGSGKTTLVRTALHGLPVHAMTVGLLTYLRYPGGIELGGRRAAFGGTDLLPMHVQPFVVQWLESACPYHILLCEGDRLGNGRFLTSLHALGWAVTLAWLECPPALAQQRRAQRASHQDPAWLAGRATKVQRLVATWASCVWRLDARDSVAQLVTHFRTHPVVQALGTPRASAPPPPQEGSLACAPCTTPGGVVLNRAIAPRDDAVR
jgi:hypothetical protein